jgi:hypothetical protein
MHINRTTLFRSGIIALSAACLVPSAASATAYNVVAGFSKTQNPNGVWSYRAGANILPKPLVQAGDASVHYWWNGKKMPNSALIGRNYGSAPYYGTSTVIYPNRLHMDPETLSSVTIRFTAPLSGTYGFSGNFKGTDQQEASHDVAVNINGKPVFTGTIGSFGQRATFKGSAPLKAGDTIDFISYTNGSDAHLSTGLQLIVAGH